MAFERAPLFGGDDWKSSSSSASSTTSDTTAGRHISGSLSPGLAPGLVTLIKIRCPTEGIAHEGGGKTRRHVLPSSICRSGASFSAVSTENFFAVSSWSTTSSADGWPAAAFPMSTMRSRGWTGTDSVVATGRQGGSTTSVPSRSLEFF